MATPAAILDIVVDANTTAATASLSRFDSRLKSTGSTATKAGRYTDGLNKRTGMLGGTLRRAAGAAAGAAVAYLSISQAKAAVTTTQDLAKVTAGLNRNLGLSAKRGSQWGAVAKSRDIDTKSLNMSFTTLSRRLTDASKGTESAVDTFKDLGITQKQIKGTQGDFNKQLLLVADAFGEAEGGAVRQQAAQKLLGRGYQTILPLFAAGSKGLKEQFGWAQKYGAELDGKTVRSQMNLAMALRESKVAFLGMQVAFTKQITPALKVANREFQKITAILADDALTKAEKWKKIGGIIEEWATKAFNAFITILPKLAEKAAEAAPKIAAALVKGFMNAGAWGALAGGMWLTSKIGLGGAAARGIGTKIGLGLIAGLVAAAAAWETSGGLKDLFSGKKSAETVGEEIGGAFATGVGAKIQKAIDTKSLPALNRFREMTRKVSAGMGDMGLEGTEAVTKLQTKIANATDKIRASMTEMRQAIHQMRAGFHSDLGSVMDDVRTNMEKIKSTFGSKSEQGRKLLEKNYTGAIQAIRKAMKEGRIATDKGMSTIMDMVRQRLAVFGIKGAQAEKIIQAQRGNATGFARGGAITSGRASGDSVPAMLERGEFVLNRKATAAVGRGTLEAINSSVPRFATGGMVDPAGPGTGVVNPAIAAVVGAWSKKYNAAINYGYDPGGGHVSPGHNVTGTATDTGPAAGWGSGTPLFEQGLKAIASKVDQILYGTAGIGTPYPNHGRGNHAHIEWGMHPDAIAGTIARFKLPRFVGKFAQGKGGAAGLNNAARALEKIMGRRVGAMGGGADMGAMGAAGSYSKSALMRLWSSVNGGLWDPNTAAAVALSESAGDPRAVGHDPGGTRGLGLWQITTGYNDDLIRKYGGIGAMFNPVNNAKAAADIYKRQGIGAWYGDYQQFLRAGGYVGSFAKGGTVPRDGVAKVHKGEHITPAAKKEWEKLNHDQLKEIKDILAEDHRLRRQSRNVLREQGKRWMLDAMGEEIADVGVRTSRYAGNGRLTAIRGGRG